MQDLHDHDGHFANYAEYSKTLRSWLVAYGIGAPVLLLLSKDAPAKVAQSEHIKLIVTLFLFGVALQIALALLNKWAAWNMYKGAYSEHLARRSDPACDNHHLSGSYKFWGFINRQSWVDMLVDVGALLAFSAASWLVLTALLAAQPAA